MSDCVAIGIDLSLTGLGLAVVPTSWDLDWARVKARTLESSKHLGLVERYDVLSSRVVQYIAWWRDRGPVSLWIEGYPTGGRAYNLTTLCELGGIVKLELARHLNLEVNTAPQSSARKLVLGKLPRDDRKKAVMQAVKAMTDVFATDDERDAFVAANWGLSELGAPFVTLARAA